MGAILRQHRLALGLSLRELAKRLHVGASTLSDYEQDRRIPSDALLTAYENALGRPADELGALRRSTLAERARDSSPAAGGAPDPQPAPADDAADPYPTPAMPDPPAGGRTGLDGDVHAATSPARRRLVAHSVVAALIGAVLALTAQDVVPVLWRVVAGDSTAVAATRRPSPVPHAVVEDGSDPHDTGCDADGRNISAVNIDAPGSYHLVVGQAIIRYSAACGAVWARFEPTPVLDRVAAKSQITLAAVRPVDGRHLTLTAPYEDAMMWGNMLLTSTGCVTVSVTVSSSSLPAPVTASTPCLQHA
jgi:transcriptional regulator with XRE-family HTH domain